MRKQGLIVCLILALVAFSAVARQGSFLDSLTFVTVSSQQDGIERTIAGDIDIHGFQVTGATVDLLKENNIPYQLAFGGYRGVLFNPVLYSTDGRFNPLGDQVIRLACQKICDRELWVTEYLNDNALAMYSPVLPTAATYPAIIVETTKTKIAHAFDEATGMQMIEDRMLELDGVKNAAGNWTIPNSVTGAMEVVEVVGTIRLSDERLQLGDYFCDQLEAAGFTTRRIYGGGGDLYNYWGLSLPSDLTYNFYTEGWGSSGISLTSASTWAQMYTDIVRADFPYATQDRAFCDATWGVGFYDAAQAIATGDYGSAEERLDLFALCEERARPNPTHIWAWNNASAYMIPEGTAIIHDLAAGTFTNLFVGHSARFVDNDGAPIVGGDMVVGNQEFLVNAINPVDGSNWTYDYYFMRPTNDNPIYTHPHTGIPIPHMVEHVLVECLTGKPVIIDDSTVADGWCELEFVDSIAVPGDAWADWDAVNQVFLTVDDVYPDGVTDAASKVTFTYPDWLWDVKWHDGSAMTIADFVIGFIVGVPLDQAQEASEIYDPYRVSDYETALSTFRGCKVVSEDPLVVEIYDSAISLYAETIANNQSIIFCPQSRAGNYPLAWHTFALGYMTEAASLGAFGSTKATDLGVDWINYVDGPQLQLLLGNLATAQYTTQFLPYAPTMSQYVTAAEITERYNNLADFAQDTGHVWVGTGPMYLAQVDSLAGITVLRNNEDYFYEVGHYLGRGFDEVGIPDVVGSGPDTVDVGSEAVFDVTITLGGEAYPAANIKEVVYLLIDASGQISSDGKGSVTGDGTAQVTLSAAETGALTAGANRLEIVVVVKTVVIPGQAAVSFTTL